MSLSTSLLATMGLVAGLTVLTAAPAVAHPEEACVVTDDAAQDAQCEDEGKDSGDESGEAQFLDDSDQVLSQGPDGVFETSKNMKALGFSERAVPFTGAGSAVFNTDLAFSGKNVIQGTYQGFRIVDASDPANPREIVNVDDCVSESALGSQGDIVVQGNILLRSWDAPRNTALSCSGVNTPAGTEGLHVFDISNPASPVAQSFVPLPCGSHTATAVPDPANNRLLVYNSASSSAVACRGIDIVSVPLDDPAAATYLRFVRSGEQGPAFTEVVTVDNGPAAGSYDAQVASFGPRTTTTATRGNIVVASDPLACGTIETVPTGSLVIVDRGVCGFAVKVKNAQVAGAGAVLVANNAPGIIVMGGADDTITIPSAMISQADGAKLRAGLPASGSLAARPVSATPDRACHDTGVILGDALMAACAGGNGVTLYTMDPAKGGSLAEPKVVYSRSFPGVTIGHSAAFTWDGEVLIYGHEPGGGGEARCQATTPAVDRTLYFLEAATGKTLGEFISPRPQTATENCTWHNYNVVPTDKGYVMVSGNYQSGISVIDFTNPASPREIAFADPKPLSETSLVVGGDWSTYWYDGFIYQSDIRRGLIIWKLADPAVAGAKKLGALNPQTQESTIELKVRPKPKGKKA